VPNRWKFQGQEHVDDLGLNWDSFKWRNHQPDIGRFFNVDPLAEKYYYNSPYAFSENKVVAHRELEGLESYPVNLQSPTAGLQYMAENFRQAFQAIGAGIDKLQAGISNTISNVISQVPVKLGIGDGSLKVTKDVTTTTTAGPNLKEFFQNNNNKPAGPMFKVETKIEAAIKTKLEVKAVVRGLDVKSSTTSSTDAATGNKSTSSELSVGKRETSLYGEAKQSGGSTTVSGGLKVTTNNSDGSTSTTKLFIKIN